MVFNRYLRRIFSYKTLLGFLSPVIAVLLAFLVGAFIILIFIKSYCLTDPILSDLAAQGISSESLGRLKPLIGRQFPNEATFSEALKSTFGDQGFAQYGRLITKLSMRRENPLAVYRAIITAALSTRDGWGNIIYRATPLIFTGLAVALAFQSGLFNIGGEGQMVMGGFAITWIGFTFVGLPAFLLIPMCIFGGILVGGIWGGIPGYLKAKRGVHEVVTTIMLNWIAVAFTQYLTMAYKPKESWIPHTFEIAENARLGRLAPYLHAIGIDFPASNQVNTAILVAILTTVFVAFLLKHTKLGYEIRAVGFNPTAAECAGIPVAKNTVLAMAISGAIAGLAGVNQVMGYKHRFRYGVFEGLGFDGIGVAFIGRNSPLGVILAALLFGVLDHGGLAIDVSTNVPREIILVLKAVILIFVVISGEMSKRLIKLIQKRQKDET